MVKIVRTDATNKDFKLLVKQLDTYLSTTDGDEHDFYHQFNSIESLKYVVMVYLNDIPSACGAFKPFDKNTVEIKRMFTLPKTRGNGLGAKVISELELWAKELKYNALVLETGKRQIEAVEFYKKNEYLPIPKYGQYKTMENSLCFKKIIHHENIS